MDPKPVPTVPLRWHSRIKDDLTELGFDVDKMDDADMYKLVSDLITQRK